MGWGRIAENVKCREGRVQEYAAVRGAATRVIRVNEEKLQRDTHTHM